jgi:prepilin-type processing-associated H-X9-DG protein
VTGSIREECDLFHFWSWHPGGANFLFADGSVHFLDYGADAVLPALGTRAGSEVATLP